MRSFIASVAFAFLAVSGTASAHISMTSPSPRAIGQLKNAPCGPTTNVRGTQTTCFEPGAKVKVSWIETVDHPGHYRIMFDDDGTDAFVDPDSFDDTCSPSSTCLVDDIADKSGGSYEQEITLPSTPCDNCTLQLVQVMTDKAPYGDGNDLYYQCADIVIKAGCGGATTTTTGATTGATRAATQATATTSGGDAGGAGGAGGSDEEGGCAVGVAGRGPQTESESAVIFGTCAGLLGIVLVRRRRRAGGGDEATHRTNTKND